MAELPRCTAEQVIEVAEAVAISNASVTPQAVADFLNHPRETVERALSVADSLGLVAASGTSYSASVPYGYFLSEATETRRIQVLRFALEGFEPYRFFKQRIALHNDPLRAARETKHRSGYANHEGEIRETLVSLGQFSGSLVYSIETGYVVASSYETQAFLAVAEEIGLSGASTDDFLRQRLGDDVYAYIQDEAEGIISNLRSLLEKLAEGEIKRTTVVHIGNACENFLIKVAREATPAVGLSGATGVTSKAKRLRDKGVIAEKHMGYFRLLGHLRNAADHGEDSEINMEWVISPEAVSVGAWTLLAAIRSVWLFVEPQRAEL